MAGENPMPEKPGIAASASRASEVEIQACQRQMQAVEAEAGKAVVGQTGIIDSLLIGLLANGHILVEGVPGIAKTLIVRTVSEIVGCEFKRIQFTPDLLPTDIIGLVSFTQEGGETVVKGPIFANFVLADEINRAPPKVQSALLEAMQDRQATIGKQTVKMPYPFFVMATQNPIESLGTYPLPQVQLDRFLMKLEIDYPSPQEEQDVLRKNITLEKLEKFQLRALLSPQRILELQETVRNVYTSDRVKEYIVQIVDATRNPRQYGVKTAHFIEFGASPRASIGLYIAAKARAVLDGKAFVTPSHVKAVAHDVLRHRILLSYEGQAEGVKTDAIVTDILEHVKVP